MKFFQAYTLNNAAKYVMLLSCVVLASCTQFLVGEGEGLLDQGIRSGAFKHRIYVATTREFSKDQAEFFSGERSNDLTMAHVDVTIPPNHQPGNIEKPRSGKTDPTRHFAVAKPRVYDTIANFVGNLDTSLDTRDPVNRDILVFIHGYNVDFSSAVLRISQFVHDTGFTGVPVLFSWASRGSTLDYVYDINSALQARDNLVKLSFVLGQTKANKFDVVAHSMGNLVTIEAMRQLAKTGNLEDTSRLRRVVMASPDIDVDLFRTQLEDLKQVKDRFYILVSDDDRALTVSTVIAGGISRVGVAEPEKLATLGLNVIDLSQIDDSGTTHHSKFAESPDIVRLIGESINQGNTLSARNENSADIAGELIRGVVEIPASVVGGTAGLIIQLGNQ
ncbi:MAG: alpha/beta hydrolase [Pseudomonadota bacterium]